MFKKLKDKIVEEAKNSPQRFQQITQSVSDKLQTSTAEENFFSIDDDVDSGPSVSATPIQSNEGGFTSVSLHSSTPIEPHQRKTSNSSMASDVSFLPRYEPGNMYHLQSDIEASASEMEDNVSNSSTQMGHITKEQVYAEMQRVRLRYHKYRGRYTDLANHYKDLERENSKMKAVLVETQDISIRRIGELREQCQLEQKAKAHLENALRVEIDEKEYIIDTLKTKVDLLNKSDASETVFTPENANALSNGNNPPSPQNTRLSTNLANAKTEIAALNERLQELKASKIISQTKEANLLTRINELEGEMVKNANNNSKLAKLNEQESRAAKMAELETKLLKIAELEAKIAELIADNDKLEADILKQNKSEEEYNLQLARDKMNLHTELQNKDMEINNLNQDLEVLKEELETYEKEKSLANNTKMENLQGQNTKLIEKVELLTARCNNMEAELLKMEQIRQENRNLQESVNSFKEVNKGFAKELCEFNQIKDNFGDSMEALEVARNDIILLSDEKTNLQQQLENFIKSNASLNEKYSDLNLDFNNLDSKYNKLLIENTSLSDSLIAKNEELEKVRSDAKSSLLTLESKITKKLQQKFDQKTDKIAREYDTKVSKLSVNDDNVKEVKIKLLAREDSIKSLEDDLGRLSDELNVARKKYNELETDHLELIEENQKNAAEKQKLLADRNLADKKLENDCNVIQQLKEQLETKFLDVTKLKERLESAKSTKLNLEQRLRDLEQILQDKEYHFAESNSKIKDYKNTIESLENALKLNDVETLSEELSTAKNNLEILNNTTSDLKNQLSIKQDELNDLTKNNDRLKNEKLNAVKQVEKLTEEKIFGHKQLTRIITEIKDEFENVQIENSNHKQQLEELKNSVEDKNMENERLFSELNAISKDNLDLRCTISDYSEELIKLNSERVKAGDLVQHLTGDQKKYKQQSLEFEMAKNELGIAVEDKNKCLQEISDLKGNLQRLVNDRQHLEQQVMQLQDVQRQHTVIASELMTEREKISRLNDELSLDKVRNRQITDDRDRLVEENERILVELEQTRLIMEEGNWTEKVNNNEPQIAHLSSELTAAHAQIASLIIQLELASVANTTATSQPIISHFKDNDNSAATLQHKITELSEMTRRFEVILEENKSVKDELAEVGRIKDDVEGERRRLQLMLGDMDRSYTEMKHESQLLKDEIQELKTSPMNLNSSSKAPNINLTNGTNNNTTTPENLDFSKEIHQLQEKVQQYKSIDVTNRTSIEFYELELERARARADKLERKLDETLVTLRHCAQLSGVDTQVEYLRHVLYNYMLGREGVVLARVIAAVCKFDPTQTEAVLKHEQQKQSLLGQLGIL